MSEGRWFTAKRDGKCSHCKQPFTAGEDVYAKAARKDEQEKLDQAREWLTSGTGEQREAAMDWLTSTAGTCTGRVSRGAGPGPRCGGSRAMPARGTGKSACRSA
jgi:hypothetical protein